MAAICPLVSAAARYAAGELAVELGSAFVLTELKLSYGPHSQHAAYMTSWLALPPPPHAMLIIATHASRTAAASQTFQTINRHLQDA